MVKRAILRIGDELEEKQVSVNKAYKFREGSMGVIKNSNIIQKQGKGNILFYAEHIEERKTHRPYYAIWVDHYTEQDIGASVGYNMIYPMEYDNKPAVIFMRKESVPISITYHIFLATSLAYVPFLAPSLAPA